MKFFRPIVSNLIFALNILLVFLVFFRDQLAVPVWVQIGGRLHPMLMHLPIGLLILGLLMLIFRKGFKKKSFQNFLNFVLYFAALSSVLTALAGLLLSVHGEYNADQLQWHLVSGVFLSLLSWWLLLISLYASDEKYAFDGLFLLTIITLFTTGHFGSVLTHGEDFVFQPLRQENDQLVIVTDSTSLYDAVIHPIFKARCMSCHNDRKAKGKLSMTSVEKILRGGKNGPIWVAGSLEKSTLIKRIHLPEEDDDHMPPAGKPQLSKNEMSILYKWIAAGADLRKPWSRFADSVHFLAQEFIHKGQKPQDPRYSFAPASKEVIATLNSPFCTVTSFSVDQPALKVDFFLAQGYDHQKLEALLKIKDQLVILNLTGMPVKDEDAKIIDQFKNLEKLNLNKTLVTAGFLSSLSGLKNLKTLSLTETSIDRKALESVVKMPSLQQVFLWNSGVSLSEIELLQKQFPKIQWNEGYLSNDVLQLTPPILVNDNFFLSDSGRVQLKHNLPGVQIRYTTDSTEPDSLTSEVYKKPFAVSGYTVIKTRAFREGWSGSPIMQYDFFKQGIQPTAVELAYPPHKDYKGEGAKTLTDNLKGSTDNFRDVAWLGFKDKPLVATFTLDDPTRIKSVTLCYGRNSAAFILPPASVELWSGNDPARLALTKRVIPIQPTKMESRRQEAIIFDVENFHSKYYKLVVQPVAKVPVWVTKKNEKGWVFVDEVIFD
jgi:uncharacterized membrane protein